MDFVLDENQGIIFILFSDNGMGCRSLSVRDPEAFTSNTQCLEFASKYSNHMKNNAGLIKQSWQMLKSVKMVDGYMVIHYMPHFFFFRVKSKHREVPRQGVESELQLQAYTTATAIPDPSLVHDLYHSSRQRQILTPWARSGIKPASSWILVRFVSCEPRWNFLFVCFWQFHLMTF